MAASRDDSNDAGAEPSPAFLRLIYINAFITGAVIMGFEMLGSKYLNPFFGSGIYTWAALISTVLAALTTGYFFGGWMADRRPSPSGLGWLIIGGGAYLALIPLFATALMDTLFDLLNAWMDQGEVERIGSLIGAMALLFIPLALLGVYSPYAIRLTLRATSRSGRVAGRIYGISTLGSIFGTLFVTFYLIPTMGSRHITFLLAAIGVLSGASFLVLRSGFAPLARRAAAVLLVGAGALALPADRAAAAPPDEARVWTVQAVPEAAERLLAFLRKHGIEARHGGVEASPPGGFTFKDLVLVAPDKSEWRAGTFQAGAFEDKPNGEVALGAVAITDLAATGKDGATLKAPRLQFTAFSFAPPLKLSLGGLRIADLVFNSPTGDIVRIATTEAAQFSIDGPTGGAARDLAVRGIAFEGPNARGSVEQVVAESIAIDAPGTSAIKGVALRGLTVDPKDQGTYRLVSFELRAMEGIGLSGPSPDIRVLDIGFKGLTVPLDTSNEFSLGGIIGQLGYSTLTLGADYVYRYDAAAKAYDLSKFEIDLADGGTLNLALKLGGPTPEEIKALLARPNPGQPPGPRDNAALALAGMFTLIAADLTWRDKSLVGRIIRAAARKQNKQEAALRDELKQMLAAVRASQADPLIQEGIDALQAFLDDPGELLIRLRPPQPANLLAIGALVGANPFQLRGLLGITITARKP